MGIIIVLGLLVLVTVVPIMISARILKAKNTGFLSCLIAAIASVAADSLSQLFLSDELLAGILAILITAMCFSVILGAKYIQSILIALLTYGIQIFAVFLFAGIGIVGTSI